MSLEEVVSEADVLVVGAGLAGLVAARDLTAAGRRVVVLEGRDRIGGRTWTTTLPGSDVPVDFGGTWVHPEGQPAVAAEIARYGLAMRSYREPGVGIWVSGDRRRVGEGGDTGLRDAFAAFDDAFEAIGRRLATGDRETALAAMGDLDVSVKDWADAQDVPQRSREGLLALAAALGGGSPSELAFLPLVLDAIDTGYALDSGWSEIGLSFVGGSGSLVGAIADGLDIRTSHVVAAIKQDDERVEVSLEDGRHLTAEAVVLTAPLNTWHDIAFDPPLRGGHAGAAERGHAGHTSKVLAIVDDVPAGLAGIGWDVPLQAVFTMASAADGGPVILTGFGGAAPIDPTDQAVVTDAIRRYVPDAKVVTTGGHDWNADRFSQGTWFAAPVGWPATTGGEDLETAHGRVAFAGGDLPEVGAGWMEGAIASGARAAQRVNEMLGADPRSDAG